MRVAAIRKELERSWAASPPLTALGLAMLLTLAFNLIGLAIDPRTIGGEAAWLKPAKFAASTALYGFSIAFLFKYLGEWPRLRARAGSVIAGSLFLEIVLIDLQAFRGTTSHFNVGTVQDAIIFSVMGLSIGCLWIASLAVAVALCRERFDDAALGWVLRAGHRIAVSGAHTVGAPDGGPGYPLMHWSRQHGDLRVPHFVGLHALQALPLFYFALGRRRRSARARTRMAQLAGFSYASLVGVLLWQALRGEPLFAPSLATLRLFEAWLAISIVSFAAAWRTGARLDRSRYSEART